MNGMINQNENIKRNECTMERIKHEKMFNVENSQKG